MAGLGILWLLVALVMLLTWLLERPSIEVRWQTETEVETAGFNILRGVHDEGPFSQLNERLIPSHADPLAGGDYVIVDDDVDAGSTYYYRLEDVEMDGNVTRHELLMVKAPGRQMWLLLLAVVMAGGGVTLLYLGLKSKAQDNA